MLIYTYTGLEKFFYTKCKKCIEKDRGIKKTELIRKNINNKEKICQESAS